MTIKQTEIKTNIFETAKILFYEQGFEKTTYKQIADILKISPGSLSYHFESKSELGNAVYISFMQKNYNDNVMNYLLNKFDTFSPKLASAIEMRLQLYVFKNDANVVRFYKELFTAQDISSTCSMTRYTLLDNKSLAFGAKESLSAMKYVAAKGASVALTSAYFDGLLKASFEEFVNYKIYVVLRTMELKDEMITDLIKKSDEITKEMNIEILPYFELRIS